MLQVGEYSLEGVTHEQAVAALKAARDPVVLVYVKNAAPEMQGDYYNSLLLFWFFYCRLSEFSKKGETI